MYASHHTSVRPLLEAMGREGYAITISNCTNDGEGVEITAQNLKGEAWTAKAANTEAATIELMRLLRWVPKD